MKFIIFFSLISSLCFSQSLNCNFVYKYKLVSVYKNFSGFGYTNKYNTKNNIVLNVIDNASNDNLESWCRVIKFDVNTQTYDYTYDRFKRWHGYISKKDYLKDVYYLEMISHVIRFDYEKRKGN